MLSLIYLDENDRRNIYLASHSRSSDARLAPPDVVTIAIKRTVSRLSADPRRPKKRKVNAANSPRRRRRIKLAVSPWRENDYWTLAVPLSQGYLRVLPAFFPCCSSLFTGQFYYTRKQTARERAVGGDILYSSTSGITPGVRYFFAVPSRVRTRSYPHFVFSNRSRNLK